MSREVGAFDTRLKRRKQPWDHGQPCDYCKSHSLPDCRHYRGGKTATHGRNAKRSG